MCMIDCCDEMSTVLDDADRVARREHKCRECARTIATGETYKNERLLFDGRVSTHKTCAHCLVVRGWLSAECGGWVYQGVKEDIVEHASEGHYGMPVARMAIGIRRSWRRRDGALMPVPAAPETTHERLAQEVKK